MFARRKINSREDNVLVSIWTWNRSKFSAAAAAAGLVPSRRLSINCTRRPFITSPNGFPLWFCLHQKSQIDCCGAVYWCGFEDSSSWALTQPSYLDLSLPSVSAVYSLCRENNGPLEATGCTGPGREGDWLLSVLLPQVAFSELPWLGKPVGRNGRHLNLVISLI